MAKATDNRGNRGQKPKIDWSIGGAIHRDWRTRLMTDRQLAEKYGVCKNSIYVHARKDNWTRDLEAKIKQRTREMVAADEGFGKSQALLDITDDAELVEKAAERGLEVIRAHKRAIKAVFDIHQRLVDEGTRLLKNNIKDIAEWKEATGALVGLTRTLSGAVMMERQAYALDEKAGKEDKTLEEMVMGSMAAGGE